jgi:hypothetical protein
MSRQPDPSGALDGVALCWLYLRRDADGIRAVLDQADQRETCMFLVRDGHSLGGVSFNLARQGGLVLTKGRGVSVAG